MVRRKSALSDLVYVSFFNIFSFAAFTFTWYMSLICRQHTHVSPKHIQFVDFVPEIGHYEYKPTDSADTSPGRAGNVRWVPKGAGCVFLFFKFVPFVTP